MTSTTVAEIKPHDCCPIETYTLLLDQKNNESGTTTWSYQGPMFSNLSEAWLRPHTIRNACFTLHCVSCILLCLVRFARCCRRSFSQSEPTFSENQATPLNTMQSVLLQRASCCTCPSRATSKSTAAAAPAAVAAAAVARQQPAALLQQQRTRQRSVVVRVRIDDLDSRTQGQPAAAEALQAYMQLEQSGELNSVTAGNIR